MRLLLLSALAVALGGPSRVAAQPAPEGLHAQVFRSADRTVVAVGEAVALDVEVLAVPTSEAALAGLLETFARAAPSAPGWSVRAAPAAVERSGRVVRVVRRFSFRSEQPGPAVLPAVTVAPGLATRPVPVVAYHSSAALDAAARGSAHLTVRGSAGGAGFVRTGAAFLVAPDVLVTAYHVVAGARRVDVAGPSGAPFVATGAWALDPARDVAVLSVDADAARAAGLVPLPLATAPGGDLVASVRDRRPAVAVRYPDGVVDGHRVLSTASPVRPGDSGGPLLDLSGAVLGLVVSGRATAGETDLLREDLCLAADPAPVVARALARRAEAGPVPLRRALADVRRSAPVAQAVDAATALGLPLRPEARAAHVSALRAAAHAASSRAALQFLAGSALEAAGETAAAAGAFADAWAGGYVPAAYALAHHRLREGNAHEALALFRQVRASAPYRHLGALGVAQAAVAAGRYAEADDALDDVLDHDPAFGPALYLRAVTLLAEGRTREAYALAVRLGSASEWAAPLHLMLRAPALRPEALRPLPALAQAR